MYNIKNNITVAGTGYVGLSIATLLAQYHHVTAVDVIPEKVEKINNRISPIQDEYIEKYLAEKPLDLTATLDGHSAYKDADFIVIAAPTNYDPVKNYFDTSHVEEVIDLVLDVNPDAVMVIKSTIPVGYCRSLYVKYAEKFKNTPALQGKKFNLLFSPEFLRESKALYDNLYPSRIIVGYPKQIEGRDEENAAIKAIAGEHLEEKAKEFVKENTELPELSVATVEDALAGAQDILAERTAQDPDNRADVRGFYMRTGKITVKGIGDEEAAKTSVYQMYWDYEEALNQIKPHRILAINRGEREGQLEVSLDVETNGEW